MSGRGEDLLILSVGLAFENTGSGSPEPHYKSTIKAEDMRAL
jgi:hypothetical protein